jgi:hypothetical protein
MPVIGIRPVAIRDWIFRARIYMVSNGSMRRDFDPGAKAVRSRVRTSGYFTSAP